MSERPRAVVPELIVATRSRGKIVELVPLIEAAGFRARTLGEAGIPVSPEEDGLEIHGSFEENALAKARWFHQRAGGAPVLADDSGLEVAALGGRPGVHSKRWSGSPLEGQALDDANNAVLLEALRGATDRRARYTGVAAIVWTRGEATGRGESPGVILDRPRGSGGFGYDPYFLSDELGKTFAEVTRDDKATVSHRARAVRAALDAFAKCTRGR